MNQAAIGSFLKELRKEKGLTQEQLAEQFHVNRRTVSRWETGNNLPDLDLLIELSDYYGVELRELLDGQRKGGHVNPELEDTLRKVAEYSSEDKQKEKKRMHILFIGGLIAAVVYLVLLFADRADGFLGGLCSGIQFGMMIVGVLMTSKHAASIRTWKLKILKNKFIPKG